MNKITIAILALLVIYACSGGGNESGTNGSLAREPINSSIDLRLGQLANNSGPVAISAALQNGESITAFTTSDNLADDFDVIYVSPNSQTLLITLDSTGRPKLAQFQNISLGYTNYTKENTVDITIQTTDSARTARTIVLRNQLIDQGVLNYLNSDEFLRILLGIDQDIDSGFRVILAATVGALRLIGCGSEETTEALKDLIPEEFLSNLCSSSALLEAIEDILGFSNYQAIRVNLTNRHPECDNPQGYEQQSACALVIWEELVEAAKQSIVGDFPRIQQDDSDGGKDSGGSSNGSSGTSSGTSSGGSGSNSGTNSGGGSNSGSGSNGGSGGNVGGGSDGVSAGNGGGGGGGVLTGHWSGGNSPFDACPQYVVEFDVTSNGDNTCTATLCNINGTLVGSLSFPIIGTISLSGSVSYDANTDSYRMNTEGIQSTLIFRSTGSVTNNNTSSGTFGVSPTSCTGSYIYHKIN